jgi:hypothetical protein
MSESRRNLSASVEATDQRRVYRIDRRTFWVSVGASIMASILFGLFVQPIVNWVSNVIVAGIGVFYKGYIDNLYYDAAQSPTDFLILMIFTSIFALPLVLYAILSLTFMMERMTDQSRTRVHRFLRVFVVPVMLPVMLLPVLIIAAGPAVSIRANSTFQRRLMALTPVITENDRKKLLGNWAMIKSKNDYLKINGQLEELAKKYSVALP